jgi:hypothetical protein
VLQAVYASLAHSFYITIKYQLLIFTILQKDPLFCITATFFTFFYVQHQHPSPVDESEHFNATLYFTQAFASNNSNLMNNYNIKNLNISLQLLYSLKM